METHVPQPVAKFHVNQIQMDGIWSSLLSFSPDAEGFSFSNNKAKISVCCHRCVVAQRHSPQPRMRSSLFKGADCDKTYLHERLSQMDRPAIMLAWKA
jgi:hypothetical protein